MNIRIAYHVEDDSVRVWLVDENGKRKLSSLLPRKEVEYITARIMKELDISADKAFDLGVYVVYLKVTWGL